MNIREQTCLIIRRGPDFLVGRIIFSTEYRWSWSPWDAWATRSWERAEEMAQRTGGDIWLFNPVAAQLRPARREAQRRAG